MVDDEVAILRNIGIKLKSSEYNVLTATDTMEALVHNSAQTKELSLFVLPRSCAAFKPAM